MRADSPISTSSSEHKFGPLAGKNQLELAKAVCPVWGYKPDRRSLQRLAVMGEILLITKPGFHPCKVYFADQRQCAEANAILLKIREQQKRA